MLKLIKNELLKIFCRKSTYLVLLLAVGFVILNNVIYKKSYNEEIKSETPTETLKNQIVILENSNNVGFDYLQKVTEIELNELSENYDKPWQKYAINNIIKNDISQKLLNGSLTSREDVLEKLVEFEQKLREENWNWFLQLELYNYNLTLEESVVSEIEMKILKLKKDWVEYRIKKGINYNGDSADLAIRQNIEANVTLITNINSLTDYEVQELKRDVAVSEFVAINDIDYFNRNNSNNYLLDMFYDYQMVIVIILLVLCGTIVSSEVSEKTIKMLLIKPYSRTKILLAKYITSFIILVFSIIFVFLVQYIVGNVTFGFNSFLENLGIIYNYQTQVVSLVSNAKYLLIELLQFLPFFLIIISLYMVIGCLTFNNTLSIIAPLFLIFFSNTINGLVVKHNISFMKYFITLNWDLTEVYFYKTPNYSYLTLKGCIIVSCIYIILFALISIILFNKKDIRNT